jgi:hypothetical protein
MLGEIGVFCEGFELLSKRFKQSADIRIDLRDSIVLKAETHGPACR